MTVGVVVLFVAGMNLCTLAVRRPSFLGVGAIPDPGRHFADVRSRQQDFGWLRSLWCGLEERLHRRPRWR